MRRLVLALALLPAGLADLVVVPYNDPRILYSGSWGEDIFELRTGLDPAGGGVNGTLSPPPCKLGDKSWTSGNIGDSFTFTFDGVAVALVTESRDDHGIFSVNVDGISSTVDGFSVAPHCGISFSQDRLDKGSHTITVTLTERNTASQFENTYIQLFNIRFDDGEVHSTTTTATSPGPSNSGGAGTGPGDQNGGGDSPQSVEHSNTGAIVGGVVGGVLAGLALAALATFLFLRHRRQGRARAGPHEHQELLAQPWAPGRPQGPPPPSGQHGQNTTSFYNNATSYYPSEPSEAGAPTHTEVPFSAYPVSSVYPASSHGSIHRSTGSRGGGTLHDEDVERIAGRLAQLVQPGASGQPEWPPSPPVPPLPAAPPVNSKAHYVAREPPAPRRDEDEPPPAY
ncbi:hypothetical protein AURDEDRAFT_114258 [Auricularia subglabra TFB-10046 SS5]|nr:hypothetical protein AURDEDRAFT_114258 [Auricularia subglabra TFB-10046 SS5]